MQESYWTRGADVNAKDEHGGTALISAAGGGHTEMVKILIDKRADMNVMEKYGNTALICAAKNGRTDSLRVLLERGRI